MSMNNLTSHSGLSILRLHVELYMHTHSSACKLMVFSKRQSVNRQCIGWYQTLGSQQVQTTFRLLAEGFLWLACTKPSRAHSIKESTSIPATHGTVGQGTTLSVRIYSTWVHPRGTHTSSTRLLISLLQHICLDDTI